MFEFLSCPHGHGAWHWVVDIAMAIPFVAFGWMVLKEKSKNFFSMCQRKYDFFVIARKKNEH